MNLPTIQLWARVLQAVKDSRLLILSPTPEFEARTRQAFGQSGIDQHRLEFAPRANRLGYLRLHDRIDIALDPLPYNGITTTNDALWMGVPVITLIGHRAAGRAAYSILANVGLNELVAQTPDEFVRIAADLAADLPRLQTYHATLRDRFLKSPIADWRGFARNVETAYRQMWHRWCATKS
jgi:predicted O-linked N-acetylglucosamine transferase (SPINDLY family)